MTSTTTRNGLTLTTEIEQHRGLKVAHIRIRNARPMTQRAFKAAVLRLAAEIEEATPDPERWLVHVEDGETFGWPGRETRAARIRIETVGGTDVEMERALAVLVAVASKEDAR